MQLLLLIQKQASPEIDKSFVQNNNLEMSLKNCFLFVNWTSDNPFNNRLSFYFLWCLNTHIAQTEFTSEKGLRLRLKFCLYSFYVSEPENNSKYTTWWLVSDDKNQVPLCFYAEAAAEVFAAEYKSVLWHSQPQIMEGFLVWLQNENIMLAHKEHYKRVRNGISRLLLLLLILVFGLSVSIIE